MAEIHGTYEFPDDLTPGKRDDGSLSFLLFNGSPGAIAQARFYPDAPDDHRAQTAPATPDGAEHTDEVDGSAMNALGAVVAFALVVVGAAAAPRIRSWWSERAFPHLKRRWRLLAQRAHRPPDGPEQQERAVEMLALSATATKDFSMSVDEVIQDKPTLITSVQAQEHLATMLLAGAVVAQELRLLSNVRVQDDPDFARLKRAMEELSSEHAVNALNSVIDADASETAAQLRRLFNGGTASSDLAISITSESVKDVLLLPGDQRSLPSQ